MQSNTITLQLDVFEGPLDLLLYLIKKHDLEISRISIAQITDQYLKYLDSLKELDIDNASEFLLMAAELAYIKSKTILPYEDSDVEEDEEVANDLISRLKEYERYKFAAKDFKERTWLHRDVFARGSFVETEEDEDTINEKKLDADGTYEVDTFELIKAFHEILNRIPKDEINHQVAAERASVTERIYEILDVLKKSDSVLFTELFSEVADRMDMVLSFLALLEMAKLRMIKVYQTSSFEPIRIQRRIDVSEDILNNENVVENLEEYK